MADGQTIDWQGLKIEVIGTPGHSPDHLAAGFREAAAMVEAPAPPSISTVTSSLKKRRKAM